MKIYQKTSLVLFLMASVAGCASQVSTVQQQAASDQSARIAGSKSEPIESLSAEQLNKNAEACKAGFKKFRKSVQNAIDKNNAKNADYDFKDFKKIGENQCRLSAYSRDKSAYVPYAYYLLLTHQGVFNWAVKDFKNKFISGSLHAKYFPDSCGWGLASVFPVIKNPSTFFKGKNEDDVETFIRDHKSSLDNHNGDKVAYALMMCGEKISKAVLPNND